MTSVRYFLLSGLGPVDRNNRCQHHLHPPLHALGMESRGQVEVGELPDWSEKNVEELDAALDAQVVEC